MIGIEEINWEAAQPKIKWIKKNKSDNKMLEIGFFKREFQVDIYASLCS